MFPETVNAPPIFVAPLIPTPPVTTTVPVVVEDDVVPAVKVTAPLADKEVTPVIPPVNVRLDNVPTAVIPV